MTRFKRRLLIGAALVLFVAAGAGFLFFRSTRATLLRAEAFKFRRMQVMRVAEEGALRFFYITNRGPGTGDGTLEGRFSTEREARLRFGSYDVRIEPSLSLAVIFDPSKWFRNEEIDIREEREIERIELVRQLREMIRDSPHRSLLVIVHGYREQFPSALRKTAFVSHVLDINTPVLLFDWPGDQPGGPMAAYRSAVEVAEASGAELAQTLELIIREVQPERLWLVANSMGGQVVADAFSLLYRQADLADAEVEIEDVVLTAPDVGLDEFDNQFKEEISALTRHLTVYVSSNDRALLASRIVNRGMRRGESTLDSRDVNQEQLEEAIRLAELIEPDSDLITLVDVTPVNRTINFHNFYLESPEVYDDMFLRFINPETPRTRVLYPIHSREGSVYWVLTRGR
ncbi:MAG: alpha/beta fold hydrolase [Thermoanaerobaculia bacterium]